MEKIGIICEYNPFHNGHIYHIDQIKKMYPDSLIVLVLNGYFMQRGEVSILSKEDKVKIALDNNIDIVIEHPFVFASNSADIFAESAIKLLNHLKVDKIIFGSESNDIDLLTKVASIQLKEDFNLRVKEELEIGVNYPTALNKAIGINISSPNDLLGIAYIKAILKNNFNIEPISIKRINDYHDMKSDNDVISASNIREKHKNKLDVNKYTNYQHLFQNINEELLFNLIKYKIITEHNLNKYLSVDEGIEYKLIKEISKVNNLDQFINKIKSKRYTYNRIRRMLIHILIGLTKENKDNSKLDYIKVLGFNINGQNYLKQIKKECEIPITRKISENYLVQKYELTASLIYDLITNNNTIKYEKNNKPILK